MFIIFNYHQKHRRNFIVEIPKLTNIVDPYQLSNVFKLENKINNLNQVDLLIKLIGHEDWILSIDITFQNGKIN